MTGIVNAKYELRLRLFRNRAQLSQVASNIAECHRIWDSLQVEQQAILAEFLELGMTPEEVLWEL